MLCLSFLLLGLLFPPAYAEDNTIALPRSKSTLSQRLVTEIFRLRCDSPSTIGGIRKQIRENDEVIMQLKDKLRKMPNQMPAWSGTDEFYTFFLSILMTGIFHVGLFRHLSYAEMADQVKWSYRFHRRQKALTAFLALDGLGSTVYLDLHVREILPSFSRLKLKQELGDHCAKVKQGFW